MSLKASSIRPKKEVSRKYFCATFGWSPRVPAGEVCSPLKNLFKFFKMGGGPLSTGVANYYGWWVFNISCIWNCLKEEEVVHWELCYAAMCSTHCKIIELHFNSSHCIKMHCTACCYTLYTLSTLQHGTTALAGQHLHYEHWSCCALWALALWVLALWTLASHSCALLASIYSLAWL